MSVTLQNSQASHQSLATSSAPAEGIKRHRNVQLAKLGIASPDMSPSEQQLLFHAQSQSPVKTLQRALQTVTNTLRSLLNVFLNTLNSSQTPPVSPPSIANVAPAATPAAAAPSLAPSASQMKTGPSANETAVKEPEPQNQSPEVEMPKINVPENTLDVNDYMSQTFDGQKKVSEEEGFLAVIGWGFNVMGKAAGDSGVRDYFNKKKQELVEKSVSEGKEPHYEAIGNQILKDAVSDGIISKHQAEHTKGNAFKAAQFNNEHGTLSAHKDKLPTEKAIESLETALDNFVSNRWDQEFMAL